MSVSEEPSREELISRLAARDLRIAELEAVNAELVARLARVEHLLSRNSGNSSSPPSRDEDPGKPAPPQRKRRGSGRSRGKQPGAPGTNLAWTQHPDRREDRFPSGCCGCGADLTDAVDLGVVDRYQQHEIPQVTAQVIQYDQHRVACGCGAQHTATRPDGARSGPVGYGPNLQALAVYLLVVHHLPAHRVVAVLAAVTGAAPSVGFVHSMIGRAAAVLAQVHARIQTLITLAYVVCCDETPIKVGPATPRPGKKTARRYLLVFCTELYTHYLLGDRNLATFKASVLTELADTGSVIVHDRYQNYDSDTFTGLVHQLCCAHLLRDLDDAAQLYPDAIWPEQIARALRELIHEANLAREQHLPAIPTPTRDKLTSSFRHGVLAGLSDTRNHGHRPGERKARLLLEALRNRESDILRFVDDLRIPPTSNQAERDLRPAKLQQNISGRLTSAATTQDRYTIRGYVSTAIKHGHNALTALRDAITGNPWMPTLPAPT